MTNNLREYVTPSLQNLARLRPLTHCLTNEVVQEITANVLLATGASPAMVVGKEEAGDFARIAQGLLVNLGTPYPERLEAMRCAIKNAQETGHPWVLDPVAAGATPWRNEIMKEFVALKPNIIRGNASEILALAGFASQGKGVDSQDSTESAVEAAKQLVDLTGGVVFITGAVDKVVDKSQVISIQGGVELTTLVVGTGCALSALTAALAAVAPSLTEAAVAASYLCKEAATRAYEKTQSPGSFHVAYLDALYEIMKDFA